MTERVRLRGLSTCRPLRPPSATARRCTRISSASGSRPSATSSHCPPVAWTCSARPLRGFAEHPGHGPRRGDADRAVPVLHRRVGLGPGQRGLGHLQPGLVGQPDGPAAAEEGELGVVQDAVGQRLGDAALGVGDDLLQVEGGAGLRGDVCSEQGQRGGRETRLHDRLLIGEVQDDGRVGQRRSRSLRVGDHRDGRGDALEPLEQFEHLGRGAGAAERDDAVIGAAEGELGGGEGVGLPQTRLLAQDRIGLSHVQRGATADDRDALALARQRLGGRADGDGGGPAPGVRLADYLGVDVCGSGHGHSSDSASHCLQALLLVSER